MHRIKNELNKLISNTILIVQLHQLKTQTVPVHIKNIDLNINNTTGMGELLVDCTYNIEALESKTNRQSTLYKNNALELVVYLYLKVLKRHLFKKEFLNRVVWM